MPWPRPAISAMIWKRFLVRIIFCLFADDIGIFEPRDIFFDFIETRTREDGSDLGPFLTQLFQVLDTPEDKRTSTLDEDLARFPLRQRRPVPRPPANTRLHRGHAQVAPGCLPLRTGQTYRQPSLARYFQWVMDPRERRAQGAHYTTEKNILKVIEPLVHGRSLGGIWAPEVTTRQPPCRRPAPLSGEAGTAPVLRPGLRLRQLPDHRLPRATAA